MTSVRDNLIAARALIDTPEKWHKGSIGKGACLCAAGAVCKAVNWNYLTGDRLRRLPEMRALFDRLPTGFYDVPVFNDDPNTTHADIMTLFDRAIAALETK